MWVPKEKEPQEVGEEPLLIFPPGFEPSTGAAVSSSAPAVADEASGDSSSDESSASSEPDSKAGAKGIQMAYLPRSAKRLLAPLDIRFSQMKMRHLFSDGRRVAGTVDQITKVRIPEAERANHGAQWKLQVPFPTIEIIRWRAKLRDEDTFRPKVDSATGEEMLDSRAHWFTLDNRRLYTLQEAALTVWPERAVVEVAEVKTGPQANVGELRKFRTLDRGRSIKIGSSSDKVPFVRWSWGDKVGLGDTGDSDSSGADAEARHTKFVEDRGVRVWDSQVLDHLSTLKQEDFGRIERSKKLSWILRRGAPTLDIAMDSDGWVKFADLLAVDFLGTITASTLTDVIDKSNKQKRRYEVKEVGGEKVVRAGTKRGTDHATRRREKSRIFAEDKPWESGKGSVEKTKSSGGGKAQGRDSKDSDKVASSKSTDKASSSLKTEKADNIPKAKAKAAAGKAAASTAKPAVKKEITVVIPEPESAKVEVAPAVVPKKAGAKAPPAVGFVPPGPAGAAGQMQMAAFYQQLAAMRQWMATSKAPQTRGAANQANHANAMRHMQMMQQMQAMQAMYFQSQYHTQMQMQLQMLGQMKSMRQYQAMSRMNEQQKAMTDMHLLMQQMQAVQDGDEDEELDEEEQELSLQEKIDEVLEEARKRSMSMNADAQPFMPSGSMIYDQKGYPEAEEDTQEEEPEAVDDIQTKINRALEAAKVRSGTAAPKAVRTAAKAKGKSGPADIQSKIAQALNAAKARSGVADPPVLANSAPPKSQTSSTGGSAPAAPEDLQAKFAQALEAARLRSQSGSSA